MKKEKMDPKKWKFEEDMKQLLVLHSIEKITEKSSKIIFLSLTLNYMSWQDPKEYSDQKLSHKKNPDKQTKL